MVSYTGEQAAAIAAIQQLAAMWADELDQHNGLDISGAAHLLTEDCRYNVAGQWREGRAATVEFYAGRRAGLGANLPVIRHTISNFRIQLAGADGAKMNFLLLFFADNAGGNPADPLAVADCRMEFRRDAAGDWLISMFDSEQVIKRNG
jgi:hypothetical protein